MRSLVGVYDEAAAFTLHILWGKLGDAISRTIFRGGPEPNWETLFQGPFFVVVQGLLDGMRGY